MSRTHEEDLFEGTTMTFGEHLDELRVALFRSLLGLVIGFLLGLLIANKVVHWITVPLKAALDDHYETVAEERLTERYGDQLSDNLREFMKQERLVFDDVFIEQSELQRLSADAPAGFAGVAVNEDLTRNSLPPPDTKMVKTRIWRKSATEVQALSTQEPFMIWLKAAFFSGLLIASPYIFWQMWAFVAAGLYSHEKRYVHMFLPISLVLFWSGALLAFFFAFQYVLAFLFGFNRALDIQAEPRISEWIGFVLFLPLGFGIAFQLPLVMFFSEPHRPGFGQDLPREMASCHPDHLRGVDGSDARGSDQHAADGPSAVRAVLPGDRHGRLDAQTEQSVRRHVRAVA